MLTLEEKVELLRAQSESGLKLADWYSRQIKQHGLATVEAFYGKYLGLNHIQRKGTVEFEGLQLRRAPRDSEKAAVKGIALAQNAATSDVSALLLQLRSSLISDGLAAIATLPPAKYHELTLTVPRSFRLRLQDRLKAIYREGRELVAAELGQKLASEQRERNEMLNAMYGEPSRAEVRGRVKVGNAFKSDDDDFDELDTLTDVTGSRVANDTQARIIAAAARGRLAGLTGAALDSFIASEINSGSTAYIDRTATGVANQTLSRGRSDEATTHDIERVEYSALLDNNVCSPCAADDGQTATDESDLTPAPNPDCEGSDFCRCFHVYISS